MWQANGILIQEKTSKTKYVKNFIYEGINAYYLYPLVDKHDIESRRLTNEQQSKEVKKNEFVNLEFISNNDLYNRYLKKCRALQIETRTLFVESEYLCEKWEEELPNMKLIGYEYCPVPIDEQVITDMDWYKPFSKYWKKLNKYGLFDSYKDIVDFVREYEKVRKSEQIGDGDMDVYICRVYLIED